MSSTMIPVFPEGTSGDWRTSSLRASSTTSASAATSASARAPRTNSVRLVACASSRGSLVGTACLGSLPSIACPHALHDLVRGLRGRGRRRPGERPRRPRDLRPREDVELERERLERLTPLCPVLALLRPLHEPQSPLERRQLDLLHDHRLR